MRLIKNCFLALILTLCAYSQSIAQYNLTYTTNFGNIAPNYTTSDLVTTGTVVHNISLAANAWSAQQTLPFPFSFYGGAVNKFYVSVNGVLTFAQTTPAILPGTNTTLPSASLPDSSIAGIWDDFTNLAPTATNDRVYMNTYGVAPNRQTWISWYSFETGNPALGFAYWAIVLEETTNNIYVTNQYSAAATATGFSVGIQLDGTTALQDATSPNILWTGNGTALTDNDVWRFQFLGPPCSGALSAGTTSGTTPICPGITQSLNVTDATLADQISYQWESSSDGFSFNTIAGATNSTYSVAVNSSTYYRRKDSCNNSGSVVLSTPIQINMNPFLDCYCTSIPSNTADEEIYNFVINTDSTDIAYSLGNNCATVAPGPGSFLNRYSNFKTLAPITTLDMNNPNTVSVRIDECDGATYYSNGAAIFIDYNQNGSFADAGEKVWFDGTATVISPRTASGSFSVPLTAIPGNTVMRVMAIEGTAGSAITPCQTYFYGETEDYLVTIPCPILATPGAVDQGICSNSAATFTGAAPYPGSTISWWDAAVGGTQLGTGLSFTTALLTANTDFYSQVDYVGCPSSSRDTVTGIVTAVSLDLLPVNVTCNGGNNGSFVLDTVYCGSGALTYSVDNGPFGPIPTTLEAGTYFITAQDATTATSAPIQVIITQPVSPTTLTATNISYYTAELGWTATGDETSYNIEYGVTGFTQGTGMIGTSTSDSLNITGLTEDTDYQFYVQTSCGPNAEWSGPFAFSTDPPLFTFDNQCGPGFIDISATGTALTLSEDGASGVTLPWSWSINGQTINTITIGNNATVIFNNLFGGSPYTATGQGMFPYAQDLNVAPIGTGGVYWESIGTAPNRRFVIEWKNLPPYFPNTGNGATFEAIVDEATGEVYYIYEDVDMGSVADDFGADAEIALNTINGNAVVSTNNTTYLTNNSCAHFFPILCPNISSTTSLIYPDEVFLNWNSTAYGENNWNVAYGPVGFDPTTVIPLTTTQSEISIPNLMQNTTYEVYIYTDCQADNLVSDGFFYTFTTLPFCSNPSVLAGTTFPDSISTSWNWLEFDPTYAIDHFNLQYQMVGSGITPTTIIANGTNNADTIVDPSLIASGVYQVWVQAECISNDTSAWVGPITVVMPVTNDTVCGAETLTLGNTYTFNNTGASVSLNETNIAPPANGAQVTDGWINSTLNNTVWYKFIAPASGRVRVNHTGNTFDGQSAIYSVGLCSDFSNNFTLIAANDNAIAGTSLAPNYTVCGLTAGSEYYVMFDGFTTSGEFTATITAINLEAGNSNPLTNLCADSNIDLFTTIAGNQTGGEWTSSIAAVNASITGSDFESAGLGYNTYTFEYTLRDGCASDSILSQIELFPPSQAGADGTINACKNEPLELLTGLNGTFDTGGDWFNPTNQATSSAITTANIAGTFNYLYVTSNGVCPADSAIINVVVSNTCDFTSIEDQYFANIQVYPNPTTGNVYISNTENALSYIVTDANGRIVSMKTNTVSANEISMIDLSTFERGVYFIELNNSTLKKVYRIVVQ